MTRSACVYEIRVAETLEPGWSTWFAEMEITPAGVGNEPGTVIRGSLPDQAALFGVLGRIRNLNLTLVEVRRLSE